MSGEKYQFDEVSTTIIEDLFDKLRARTVKEFGKGWERQQLAGAIARKALFIYVQPNAEELITEYLNAGQDGYKSEAELDTEMTYDQRLECREIEVMFEAERYEEEGDSEISTRYTIELTSSMALDDIIDVPSKVRDQVAAKLAQAEDEHMQKVSSGELTDDDKDFDSRITFNKQHKFILKEVQESLNYSVEHCYDVTGHTIPMLTYEPNDNPNIPSPDPIKSTATEYSVNEYIGDQQQRNDTLAMFDEIMKYQEIEKPISKRPAELRVAQIMAILAILEHGEAQNEEQEAIIKDLT